MMVRAKDLLLAYERAAALNPRLHAHHMWWNGAR
jgi:hypothetical protein